MGYWGPGNLESDYALDELSIRCAKLVGDFLERARDKLAREWDEYEHTALLVDFEFFFALESKRLLVGELPAPEEIDALKKSFLADYDAYCEDQPRPEFRKVLVSNFNRLRRICAKHAQQ